MKITKDNIRNRWNEVSGFDFYKLLEDNQRLSLPMITLIGSRPVIFAFVYANHSKDRQVVSQRHFWDMDRHHMVLCKNLYGIDMLCENTIDREEYLNIFCEVAEILFSENLSCKEKSLCKKYFELFKDNRLRNIYFSENKPLIMWAEAQSLL